jgi:SAM-dependent methyltransferase
LSPKEFVMTQPVDRRPAHAQRTAQDHATFFLPHLRPGMRLLDLGCGPGTVTAGLAQLVAPGATVGVDLEPAAPDGTVTLVACDVHHLPFPEASFDAVFASALLQHVPDPLAVLREARRVSRQGAVIGVVDADWDGQVMYPTDPVLERSLRAAVEQRQGTSPYVGRRLAALLGEAGFTGCVASARAVAYGTPEQTQALGDFTASLFREEEYRQAWTQWGRRPGAYLARFWCEAVAWAA